MEHTAATLVKRRIWFATLFGENTFVTEQQRSFQLIWVKR